MKNSVFSLKMYTKQQQLQQKIQAKINIVKNTKKKKRKLIARTRCIRIYIKNRQKI